MRSSATRAAAEDSVSAESFESFYRGQVDTVYRALALTLGNPGRPELGDLAMVHAEGTTSVLPGPRVVVARVLLDLSTAETAAALGIADGTVKSARWCRAPARAAPVRRPTRSAPPPVSSRRTAR